VLCRFRSIRLPALPPHQSKALSLFLRPPGRDADTLTEVNPKTIIIIIIVIVVVIIMAVVILVVVIVVVEISIDNHTDINVILFEATPYPLHNHCANEMKS